MNTQIYYTVLKFLLMPLMLLVSWQANAEGFRFDTARDSNFNAVTSTQITNGDVIPVCFYSQPLLSEGGGSENSDYTTCVTLSTGSQIGGISSGFLDPGVIANTTSYTLAFNVPMTFTQFQIGEFNNLSDGANYVFTPNTGTAVTLADNSPSISGGIATLNPVDWNGITSLTVSYQGAQTWRLGLDNMGFTPTGPAFTDLNSDSSVWAGIGNTVNLDAGGNAGVSDTDLDALNGGNGDYSGASLTVQRSSTAVSSDEFSFDTDSSLFTVSGSNLQSGGQTFATFTNSNGLLSISFTSSGTVATTALVEDVVQHILYRNDTPAADAVIRFSLNDGVNTTNADVTVTSDSVYVTDTADTATIDLSDGVSFSEAVAIALADTTGSQTLVFAPALASTELTINNVSITESLIFDADAASGLSITGGVITLDAGVTLTFSNGSADSVLVSSVLAGAGNLAKVGVGTLSLSGNNTFTGSVSISGGAVVEVSHANALGTNAGNTSLTASTLRISGGVTLAETFSLNSVSELQNVAGNNEVSGGIAVDASNNIISATTATQLTLSGVVSGVASQNIMLNKSGYTGTVVLSGNNTFNNYVSIQAGTVLATHNNALGGTTNWTQVVYGATLALQGGLTMNETLRLSGNGLAGNGSLENLSGNNTVTGGVTLTSDARIGISADQLILSGVLSGSRNLTKIGSGTLSLSGSNTYTGTTTVSAGTFEIASDYNLGAGVVTLELGSTLSVSGTTTIDNAISLSGDASLGGTGNFTVSSIISGSGSLTKVGTGRLTLSGNNSYNSSVTIAAGTLRVEGSTAVPDNVPVTVASGATLEFGNDDNLGPISGSGTINMQQMYVGFNQNTDSTFSGVIIGTNTGKLTKSGTGTLTLSGNNTYGGLTVISGGSLNVTGALANSYAMTVNNGGTLRGTGSVFAVSSTNTVTVMNGGTVSPGVAGPGLLTINGNLTIASGGNLAADINGTTLGTDYDAIAVNGTVSVTGANLIPTHGYSSTLGDTYRLLVNDGVDSINGNFSGLAERANLIAGGNSTVLKAHYGATDGGATTGGNEFMLIATPTVSGPPTIGTATVGNTQASVSFSAPANNGGAAITSYTVTSSPGGLTATGAGSPLVVTGLTNGTAYTFSVTATNSEGASVSSSASNSVTPIGPQTITFANPGPQNFGTSPTLSASSDSGLTPSFTSSTTAVCTITTGGVLTFVTTGTCTVNADQAGNAAFSPAAQVSRSFSINAVVAGAPTIGTATTGDTQASITFSAPANNGGAAITGYTVTSSPGGLTASGAGSPLTVTGLTNGTAYTFTVTATNSAGSSATSSASNSVTPIAAQTITFANPGSQDLDTSPTLTATASSGLTPSFTSSTTAVCTVTTAGVLTFVTTGTCTVNADQAGNAAFLPAAQVSRSFSVDAVVAGAPTIGTATTGDTQASITFSAPANDGGTAITGYTVTSSPGGLTASGASSPLTVTGLTNGTAYTFTVTATNSEGDSVSSSASNSVTPIGPQTIIFLNPGAQNFGTSPTLMATASSGLTPSFTSSTSSVCTITTGGELTIITIGTCTINADESGNSAYLAAAQVSQTFAINAVAADAPTIGSATAGDAQASVSFAAPTNNGSAEITGYTVTSSPGGLTASGASSPLTITGLTNGVSYTFSVTATNSVGVSSASAASNAVTPNGAPVITSTPLLSVNQGASYSYTFTATDTVNDTLTLSAQTIPAWLTFDINTGVLSGIPGNDDVGVHTIKLRVSDGAIEVNQDFTITVANTNDAPTITGTPVTTAVEGVAYSFTVTGADVDVGDSLSYQLTNPPTWLSVNSSGLVSGTPTNSDVGTASNIVVSVTDNVATTALPAFSIVVDSDMDGDTIGDLVDPDIDGDGMSNDFEIANGLDPRDASDASGDLDGDGISNLDEFLNNTDPAVDDYGPIITLDSMVTIDAVALRTVLPANLASANDALDGDVAVTHDLTTERLVPGRYTINWSAVDTAGNVTTEAQTLDVRPLANWQVDQQTNEGSTVTVSLYLNGDAPIYPVTADYTVSGTATNPEDHNALSGTLTITEGRRGSITVNIASDANSEADETINFELDSMTNAVAGVKQEHVVTIGEVNHAPSIVLSAALDSAPTKKINLFSTTDGMVTISANVSDVDQGDSHTLQWIDKNRINGTVNGTTYSFDPATVGKGVYRLTVIASDDDSINPLSGSAVINLTILEESPVLSNTADTDGDGIDDQTEGLGDSDDDNVPDFADNVEETNLLAIYPTGGETTEGAWFVETQSGLSIKLNLISSGTAKYSPLLTPEQIVDENDRSQSDGGYIYDGGVFDFVVSNLPVAGEPVLVVIPQLQAIPEDAVYRKLIDGRWSEYVEDANNSIYSASGELGFCPPPGSVEYTAGLTAGHYCVQLAIEDGGANDADGEVNGTILDPGGVGKGIPVSVRSSGGSMSWPILLLLSCMALMLRRRTNNQLVKGA